MVDIGLAVMLVFLMIFGVIEKFTKNGDLLVEYAMIVGQSKLGAAFIFVWTAVAFGVVYVTDTAGLMFTANMVVLYTGWSLWCMLSSPNLKC